MSKPELIWYEGNWYHPNFLQRRKECVRQAEYTCQHCGRKKGETYTSRAGREESVVIQAHHPNNDRENPDAVLIALCKPCHMRVDGFMHVTNKWRKTRRKQREEMIEAGQLELPFYMN